CGRSADLSIHPLFLRITERCETPDRLEYASVTVLQTTQSDAPGKYLQVPNSAALYLRIQFPWREAGSQVSLFSLSRLAVPLLSCAWPPHPSPCVSLVLGSVAG